MLTEENKFTDIKELKDFTRMCMRNFDRPMLLAFYAEWNPESVELRDNIKANFEEEQIDCAFGFVDTDRQENHEIVSNLKAVALPYIILIDSQKQILYTYEDNDPAQIFESLPEQVELFKQNHEIERTRVFDRISKILKQNKVVAFLKGTQQDPKCKFTRQFVETMNEQNVSFADVDIINDKDNLREWIKVYSGWKTLPQLFINGEIVGGVDILNELISEGEFLGMIPKENIKGNPKLEIQSILQEEDIILITTSDHESKPDEATYSDFVQKHLQLKALIFRTFDIESKPEIIPIFRQVTENKQLPILFWKSQAYKAGSELADFAKNTDLTQHFEGKYFRSDIFQKIKELINSHPIMVFMKGSHDAPQCGFSRTFVGLLDQYKIDYQTFDILSDELVREKLKEYSNWKTYPQLYIKGELIGGLDIVKELIAEGEFEGMVQDYKKVD